MGAGTRGRLKGNTGAWVIPFPIPGECISDSRIARPLDSVRELVNSCGIDVEANYRAMRSRINGHADLRESQAQAQQMLTLEPRAKSR